MSLISEWFLRTAAYACVAVVLLLTFQGTSVRAEGGVSAEAPLISIQERLKRLGFDRLELARPGVASEGDLDDGGLIADGNPLPLEHDAQAVTAGKLVGYDGPFVPIEPEIGASSETRGQQAGILADLKAMSPPEGQGQTDQADVGGELPVSDGGFYNVCPRGYTSCFSGACCPPGTGCANDGYCAPYGRVYCGRGRHCPIRYVLLERQSVLGKRINQVP
ncbi:hypothetical protein E1180_17820 [Roseibium denhamense]|uniref:hypothetical protein n=1 Tax=Roseibium denhamense TaxID=76305 RepID=UPI0012BC25DA|nr:hypothetical protein [Roseibium denhamense]MTI07363.1 hypothetical protein [Roseibium denhamense]